MARFIFYDHTGSRSVRLVPADSPVALSSLISPATKSTLTAPEGLVLSCSRQADIVQWQLHVDCRFPVLINGIAVDTGIRVLSDRDTIRWSCAPPIWFSTEQLACIEPFPDDVGAMLCPRCKLPLRSGQDATLCPRCGTWQHEDSTENLECWSHAETCTVCPHPTAADTGYRWSPDAL